MYVCGRADVESESCMVLFLPGCFLVFLFFKMCSTTDLAWRDETRLVGLVVGVRLWSRLGEFSSGERVYSGSRFGWWQMVCLGPGRCIFQFYIHITPISKLITERCGSVSVDVLVYSFRIGRMSTRSGAQNIGGAEIGGVES